MADPRFFQRSGPITLDQLASLCGVNLPAESDPTQSFEDVADLATAGSADICFLSNKKLGAVASESACGALLTTADLAKHAPSSASVVLVSDAQLAFVKAANALYEAGSPELGPASIDPSATVHPTAVIGEGTRIGGGCQIDAYAVIGAGVELGADASISAHSVITHCIAGDGLVTHPGAKVGQDGFGYVHDGTRHVKIPQLGRVVIGDDVELGAGTTIDRGMLGDTVIGSGCRIDNLVQIGHNVRLGAQCIIAAQTGLSGSCTIGNGVLMGGQVGMADHVTVGDGARIAAQSGVMRDILAGETVMGYPAKPVREFWRETAAVGRISKPSKPR